MDPRCEELMEIMMEMKMEMMEMMMIEAMTMTMTMTMMEMEMKMDMEVVMINVLSKNEKVRRIMSDDEQPTKRELGFDDDDIILACFNQVNADAVVVCLNRRTQIMPLQLYKIEPEVFDVWMKILKRVPRQCLHPCPPPIAHLPSPPLLLLSRLLQCNLFISLVLLSLQRQVVVPGVYKAGSCEPPKIC